MRGMFRLSLWHPATKPASTTLVAIRKQFIRLIGRLLCASRKPPQLHSVQALRLCRYWATARPDRNPDLFRDDDWAPRRIARPRSTIQHSLVDELEIVRPDRCRRAPCVVDQSRSDEFQVRRGKRIESGNGLVGGDREEHLMRP